MKLYTEEQVIKAIELAKYCEYDCGGVYFDFNLDSILLKLTPIELPSDEDIKKMMELDGMEFDEFDPYDVSYLGGATWMRNKIQGNHIGDVNKMVGGEQ